MANRFGVLTGLCLVLATLTRPGTATEPVTILDLPLGQPFTVPACSGPEGKFDLRDSQRTCAWPVPQSMVFPPICNVMPCAELKEIWIKGGDFVIGFRLYATVHAGVLDALGFVTRGIKDQEQVMAKLAEKFGPPLKFEKTPMQNGFGAQFLIYHASWLNGDVVVFFDVDNSNPDNGSVLIETPAELQRVTKAIPQSRGKL